MASSKPLHQLPLPARTLQSSLPQLPLSSQSSAQRRSTIFKGSTSGIWARVNPMWASWPIRLSKEEAEDLGVNVERGEKIDVEDILKSWEPNDVLQQGAENGLDLKSSKRREKLEPIILGISPSALKESLPHLDVGDLLEICKAGKQPTSGNSAREIFIDILSGRKVLASDNYGPWATRYSGHQFGQWAGQLGDGRVVSVLETESEQGGRQEIQLKGAGRTPFSRADDGLAHLRSGIREFLGCEAVAALGIPTTRALTLLTIPLPYLPVFREGTIHPSSLLTRVAPCFIRVGHFEALNPPSSAAGGRQFFVGGGGWIDDQTEEEGEEEGNGNLEGLRDLGDWMKEMMEVKEGWKSWVDEVIKKNAEMIAKWQVYGYMNGVINTDNVTLMGITIDYGPYAFMDVFDQKHVSNQSDPSGMYAYRNQVSRIQFTLSKFIDSVSPLLGYESIHSNIPKGWSEDKAREDIKDWGEKGKEVMKGWEKVFEEHEEESEMKGWYQRFGLKTEQQYDQRDIKYDFLNYLQVHDLDFHTAFRGLCEFSPTKASPESGDKYIKEFVPHWVRSAADKSASDDSLKLAEEDFVRWFGIYAKRANLEDEKSAWDSTDDWEPARAADMRKRNPTFVLRQWILEELLGKMEKALTDPYKAALSKDDVDKQKVEEGIRTARTELWKILEMATNPFENWGQGEGSEEELEAQRRLCGVGAKEMFGYQCGCSS